MHRSLTLIALLILPASACRSLECDDEIVYGLEVLIDEPGGPYAEPISIRYRVDGGTWAEIADTEMSGIPDVVAVCTSRNRCLLGPELDGLYEVVVRRAPANARFESTVSAEFCHVRPTVVPLELPAT